MLNKISSLLTSDNIEILYKLGLKIAEVLKSNTQNDWKKKSIFSIIISAIAIALFIVLLIYFVATHRITPLLIYLVCMTPILAYGLGHYSRSMVTLSKEYEEYRTAIRTLLQKVVEVANVTETDAVIAVGAVLATVKKTDGLPIDDETTLAEIKELPDYPAACHYAEMMEAIGMALEALKNEGLDVSNLLEQFEVGELESNAKLYETIYSNNPMKAPEENTSSSTTNSSDSSIT